MQEYNSITKMILNNGVLATSCNSNHTNLCIASLCHLPPKRRSRRGGRRGGERGRGGRRRRLRRGRGRGGGRRRNGLFTFCDLYQNFENSTIIRTLRKDIKAIFLLKTWVALFLTRNQRHYNM